MIAPITPRALTTTARDLWCALEPAHHRAQVGVRLIYSVDIPGTLTRKPSGFEFAGYHRRGDGDYELFESAIEVWHGDRRVYAMTGCGRYGIVLYYGEFHPMCEIEIVPGDERLEVREIATAPA